MKVLTSPVWISPSMEAWRRSDPGALPWLAHKPRQSCDHVSHTLVLTQGRGNITSYAIVGFGNIGEALAKAFDRRDRRQPGALLGVLRPVSQVIRAKDETDAIRIAND
jgi:hypothetical protein